jgi:hypothetical protein
MQLGQNETAAGFTIVMMLLRFLAAISVLVRFILNFLESPIFLFAGLAVLRETQQRVSIILRDS